MNANLARLIALVAVGIATVVAIDANALALTGAKSRKAHGAAGTFDLTIDTTQPLTGNVTVESRAIGAGHTVVFQFDETITVPGTVTVTDGSGPAGMASAPAITGAGNTPTNNEVSVTISGIADNKRLTVTLTGVNGSGTASASIGFLTGDVNSSRSINASDTSTVKAHSGHAPESGTFAADLNDSGAINASDISAAKVRAGRMLAAVGALTCGGSVRCVGAGKAYVTIQAAVNATVAGDIVLVDDGNYTGFVVSHSGTVAQPIVIRAAGNAAVINSPNSNGNEGVTISNSNYITVEGFTVTGMSGIGIASHNATAVNPMHGLVIRNNTVSGSGQMNIYLSQTADSLVEANSCSGSLASHGIYLSNGGSDNTILRGNRTFNNAVNGIHLNGDLSIGGDGLHTNVTLDGNIVYGNVANGFDIDGLQDALIQNNVVYGNGNNAFRVFQIDAAAGPKNLRIVNNTFLTNGGWAIKLSQDLGGHVIFNNILFGPSGSISVGSTTSAQSNNNIGNDKFSYNNDSTTVSLATWRTQTGEDMNSLNSTAAAVFINAAANDYRLSATSPARNAGAATFATVNAPATDVAGAARPNGAAVDIGAYETP